MDRNWFDEFLQYEWKPGVEEHPKTEVLGLVFWLWVIQESKSFRITSNQVCQKTP